jgi:hypothetical protein
VFLKTRNIDHRYRKIGRSRSAGILPGKFLSGRSN